MIKPTQKLIETLNFFDLLETKNSSLFNFFAIELKEILKKKLNRHLFDNGDIIHFYTNEFFIKFPNKKLVLNKNEVNTSLSLYVPAELFISETREIIKTKVFVCNLPILLNNSYFWINGIPKIINHQLTFDPVFLVEKKENTRAVLYDENQTAQIVFSFDEYKQPYLIVKGQKKIIEEFQKNKFLSNKVKEIELHKYTSNTKLTRKARYILNQKFNTSLPLSLRKITSLDIKNIIDYASQVDLKDINPKELDDLDNKTIKDIKDYFSAIIIKSAEKIQNTLTKKPLEFRDLLNRFESNQILGVVVELFSNSDVSIPIDQVNSLSELSQQRKVLNLKKQEGNKNISIDIRNIHPSIFGRFCVIETPEGESAGLINNYTTFALINKFGLIETPLNFLKNQIEIIKTKVRYFGGHSENLEKIGFSLISESFRSTKQKRPYEKNKTITEGVLNEIDKTFISYLQIFSIACANIPFLEHNDGNRILMGATMQRQAVPLIKPQQPIVASGLEDILAHSALTIKSLTTGVIIYSDATKVIVKTPSNHRLIYYLDKLKSTFNGTVNNSTINLWPGEKVYFGQILANNFSISNSELSLGTNLTVAYMNWDGFNFEDAIVISDRLVKQDTLTSLHIKSLLFEINDGEDFYVLNQNSQKTNKKINNLNKYSVVKVGSVVHKGDVLLIKSPKDFNINLNKKEEGLVFIETDFNGIIQNVEIQDSDISIKFNNNIGIHKKTVKIDILQMRKIQIGDKLSGRFGNKGVISRIVPETDMPFLIDGSPIDVLLNPLGIPSRMNIGQIFETLLGIIGSDLNKRFSVLSFDENFSKHASRILINEKLKESLLFSGDVLRNTNPIIDKRFVIDGRSGEFFDNPVLVGRSYILKLYHLVEEKITSRTLGPSSLITNQPLRGKKSYGGQRFGEMEVWALEAYGASYSLKEILTLKSDDVILGDSLLRLIEQDLVFDLINYSKSLFILDLDLKALGFSLSIENYNLEKNKIVSSDPISVYKGKVLQTYARDYFTKLYGQN